MNRTFICPSCGMAALGVDMQRAADHIEHCDLSRSSTNARCCSCREVAVGIHWVIDRPDPVLVYGDCRCIRH